MKVELKKNEKIIKYNTSKAVEVEDRVLRLVGSDETIDRHDELVKASGWKIANYKKNPVVMVNHNHFDLPVAKTKKVWIDKKKKELLFDVEFPKPEVSSEGDTIYKLYKHGYMNATSVGFLPNFDKIEYGKSKGDPRVTFNDQELLELSLVSVPANPNALLTGKSIDDAIEAKVVDKLEMDELMTLLKKTFEEPEIEEDGGINTEQKILCKECNTEIEPICKVCDDKIKTEAFYKKVYESILK